jgi:tRNA pseudouridine32 synthase/23S rRNA pseudouridine746 synthase
MAALGAPIHNDRLYPQLTAAAASDFARPLQLLARELRFADPLTGAERVFVSRLALQGGGVA